MKATKKKTKTKKKETHEISPRLNTELAVNNFVPLDAFCARVKHFANLGDMIAVLPSLKKYHQLSNRKVILVQKVDQIAEYYPGATHPTQNSDGQNVCVNQKMFDMIKPLIEAQPYIQRMEKYDGQKIDLDFDIIRGDKTFVNLPHGMIQAWIMYAFPDLGCDLSKPWVELPPAEDHPILKKVKGKVVINFTERYRNHYIDYFFLRNYSPDLIFAGTEREYNLFTSRWQLIIPKLEVNDFLEYAYALQGCKFFLGNQSFAWNLAESLKSPRLLELCRFAPNCQPFVGEESFGYYHQVGVEYYFRKMYNELK